MLPFQLERENCCQLGPIIEVANAFKNTYEIGLPSLFIVLFHPLLSFLEPLYFELLRYVNQKILPFI